MSSPLLVLVLALCLSTGLCLESFKADDGYEVFPAYNTSRYKVYDVKLKWLDAVSHCQSDGDDAHLLIVNSKSEANVARELFGQLIDPLSGYPWVGINDIEIEGRWVTVQGDVLSELGYDGWALGSPTGSTAWNCGHVHVDGLYDDDNCELEESFFCEKPNV